MGANFFFALNSIKEKLNALPLVCQLPIGAENNLEGIIDLITEKAYYFRPGDEVENYQLGEIPVSYLSNVKEYQEVLVEKVIEYDEKLGEKYLMNEQLTSDEIRYLIRQATLSARCFPVLAGSVFKNVVLCDI